MPLKKTKFTLSDLALVEVQSFNCGDLKRDQDVARFLTTDVRDLLDKPELRLQVWLYRDDTESLVGFSSLGKSEWSYPKPTGIKVVFQIIPNLAVAVAHKGNGYSKEIVEDVLVEAIALRESISEMLGLYVHVDNSAAIHVYTSVGFENYGKPKNDQGALFQRMVLKLPSQIAS